MPRLTVDGRPVEVPPGSTLLDAARTLGIDVPTLCFLEGYQPSTSCLVCMVRVRGRNGFVPSCATRAEDGMEVESETPEVHQVRKTALELLLSDHVGDCLAPCYFTCPAHMDIPLMLRQITAENLCEAIVTVKDAIALPAVLGRVCPKPCEKGCRRSAADGAVAVCQLKRFVADTDLASEHPYLPECRPPSGKRVAIVGAGPTGLSAAYYLRRAGHAVTIFDEQAQPGGRLLRETTAEELPRDVLASEIGLILGLGVELRAGTRVEVCSRQRANGRGQTAENRPQGAEGILPTAYCLLPTDFDAVLLACGNVAKEQIDRWGLKPAAHGILVDKETFQTSLSGVFAAGNAIRAKGMVVRSAADGHEVAGVIREYLRRADIPVCPSTAGKNACPPEGRQTGMSALLVRAADPQLKPFSVRIGKLEQAEVAGLVTLAGPAARQDADPAQGFHLIEAVQQAGRCLHCDCRALSSCKLRRYAALYGADAGRFRGDRRPLRQFLVATQGRRESFLQPAPGDAEPPAEKRLPTPFSGVIYEPGKCIDCGLCIQIATAAKEPLGLAFVGRGFDVRIGVPFNRSLDEALGRVAAECIAACPTAALAWREEITG
jgi:ferredoxin